ncbi:hypothetical protein B0H11DRAFT_1935930 [Mycena galericulata]|nr:hypothetical protein B0H11DRAFT_1935930 [Mycena galericulata]
MPSPSLASLASSDESSQHPSTCSCGRTNFDSLYRTSTGATSLSTQSPSDADLGLPPTKLRFGGRGGAGSRPRSPPITKHKPAIGASTVPLNSAMKWLKRTPSNEVEAAMPAASSLAGRRRGSTNVPAPLVLLPSHVVPDLNTPPLSATSTSTHSTATDSEFSRTLCTPRSPYFYFDEPLDSPRVSTESPFPSPTNGLSRSLRRLASRTQVIFSKELLKPPPMPMPPTPNSPTSRAPLLPSSPPLILPPQITAASEWYDPPEDPELGEPACPSPLPLLDSVSLPAPLEPAPAPPPTPIVIVLPTSGGRTRSASEVTVKPHSRRKHREKGERKQREAREQPCTHGGWNRSDMGEVIVGLRMLK